MRNQKFNIIFLLLFSFLLSPCVKSYAQSEPTIDETFEWVKGKLISYGDNVKDVRYDKGDCSITVTYFRYNYEGDNGDVIVEHIAHLNANSFAWSSNKTGLQISSMGNYNGSLKIEYDYDGTEKNREYRGYAKFLFKPEFATTDNLPDRFTKAMKLLIKQCGGYSKEEKF
jgi:hypothetical protein